MYSPTVLPLFVFLAELLLCPRSMVGAIKGCTGKEPVLVGKPSPFMADYLSGKLGVSKERILVVGDNLNTDILFSVNSGLIGCLVLTGVTTEKTLLSQENGIQPDFYCESINQLVSCIPSTTTTSPYN